MIKKLPKANLRSFRPLLLELSIICSLLFFIAAAKINYGNTVNEGSIPEPNLSDIPIILQPITIQQPNRLPPQVPQVPVSIPDSTPIDPDPIEFTAEYAFDDSLFLRNLLPKSQKDAEEEIVESIFVEVLPKIRGGIQALYKNVTYPETAKLSGIEGKVIVEFVVNKNGSVENPVVLRKLGGGCDEEVLQALKLVTFSPGIQNGQFVFPVRMRQSVSFSLLQIK